MNLSQIQDLIKFVSKSGVSEVEIEQKDFKIVIKTGSDKKGRPDMIQVAAPQVFAAPAAIAIESAPATESAQKPTAPAAASSEDSKYVTIKSPMIGTFYRSASPDKPPFIEVGSTVKAGDTVCVIEAMKLFNEIESELSGKVVKVLASESTPVEYDQPLFLIDPS
ncbi:MAG: acetyl-CoA carboxylase biotin carboxyl carrier protein [Flavobacteriales bacterium]|nr:acetyl-CoA carboxylase biotin carboxyl carrier protein [Flavobacteriales bacterium]